MTLYLGSAMESQDVRRPKLTAEQKAKVRSLMEDEGETRAAATAWVLAFEARAADAHHVGPPIKDPLRVDCDVCRKLLGAELAKRGAK